MRRLLMCAPMIALCFLLSSCGGGVSGRNAEELALQLRTEYLAMESCTAQADITADYGQRVAEYSLDFTWEQDGEAVITVTAPEDIAGICARLRDGQTTLEYDGVRIETGPLTEQGLTPIDAVPTLLTGLRQGFLAQCALEETEDGTELLHTVIRDPELKPGTGTELQLWTDLTTHAPVQGEISRDGFTVIRCLFRSFSMSSPSAPSNGS